MEEAVTELFGKKVKESPNYGRIASDKHFKRLTQLLKDQLQVPGSKIAFGGDSDSTIRYIAPTVITGITLDEKINPIMREEIFGPLLPIIEIESLDEAIKYVNSRPNPLSIMPFTNDPKFLCKTIESINSGNTMCNDALVNFMVDELPFGGVGESGLGCYHGKHGFDSFTRKRGTAIRRITRLNEFITKLRYPNILYNISKKRFDIVMSLLMPSLPSRTFVKVRNTLRQFSSLLKLVFFILSLVLAFKLGSIQ